MEHISNDFAMNVIQLGLGLTQEHGKIIKAPK